MSRALERVVVNLPAPPHASHDVERGAACARGARAGETLLETDPYWCVPRRGASFARRLSDAEARVELALDALIAACDRGPPSSEVRMAMGCLLRRRLEDAGDVPRARYDVLGASGYDAIASLHGGVSAREHPAPTERQLEKRMEISSAGMVVAALMAGAMRRGATPDEIERRMEESREKYGIDGKSCVELLSILEANGFSICGDDQERLGFGIYPDASLFNHSPAPNAQVSFRGKTLIVRALRDIAPGEEVTITYGEQYMSQEWARRNMLHGYGFDTFDAFGITKRKAADEARERAMREASRTPLAMKLGVHVDLGEDVSWYDGELTPDQSLASDKHWHAIAFNGVDDENAGIMLIKTKGEHSESRHVCPWDEVVTWGKFPPGVDRELTALNFAKGCDLIGRSRMLIELGVREADDFKAMERVVKLFAGDGDKVAGVGSRHEARKYLWLNQGVLATSSPDLASSPELMLLGYQASDNLEKLYKSAVGWAPIDSVYMHIVFQLFKLGQLLLGVYLDRADTPNFKRQLSRQIQLYNQLNKDLSHATVPESFMREEWAQMKPGAEQDLKFLRSQFVKK